MAPNTSASLDSVLKDFSQLRSEFLEVNTALARMNEDLKKDNADLRSELAQVKAVVNRQAAYLAELDSELDSLCQYGRRENVVFSNLAIPDDKDVKPQVIKLCKELDVEISVEDIVDAHPLPSKTGPKKVIARFHQRDTAKKIFSSRRKSKLIPDDRKSELAANAEKGFGIQSNLTPKRSKLYSQVAEFSKQRGFFSWIDYKTGNILLRV